jgi:hypothetical protein
MLRMRDQFVTVYGGTLKSKEFANFDNLVKARLTYDKKWKFKKLKN